MSVLSWRVCNSYVIFIQILGECKEDKDGSSGDDVKHPKKHQSSHSDEIPSSNDRQPHHGNSHKHISRVRMK
jgi:hypothetical protein